MGTRRKSRELALQMLFQWDMGKQDAEQVRRSFWSERKEASETKLRGFTEDLFKVAVERAEEIEPLIEKNAGRWKLERMAAVDRNVLRMAVAEFLAYPKTPKVIVINEALEIGHKYSSPESVNFLNGVLDSVARELDSR